MKKNLILTYNNLIVLFFLFLFFSLSSVKSEISKVEKAKISVSFEYEGNKIITNNNLIYVGQTRGFTFLYEKESKVVRVYERDILRHFNFKHKLPSPSR